VGRGTWAEPLFSQRMRRGEQETRGASRSTILIPVRMKRESLASLNSGPVSIRISPLMNCHPDIPAAHQDGDLGRLWENGKLLKAIKVSPAPSKVAMRSQGTLITRKSSSFSSCNRAPMIVVPKATSLPWPFIGKRRQKSSQGAAFPLRVGRRPSNLVTTSGKFFATCNIPRGGKCQHILY
jgi:hypothetical protein